VLVTDVSDKLMGPILKSEAVFIHQRQNLTKYNYLCWFFSVRVPEWFSCMATDVWAMLQIMSVAGCVRLLIRLQASV
jgi:hypothetical protein